MQEKKLQNCTEGNVHCALPSYFLHIKITVRNFVGFGYICALSF